MAFLRTRTLTPEKRPLPKRLINSLFRVCIVVLPGAALYYELQGRSDLPVVTGAFLQQMRDADKGWLVLACLLIPFNWMAEVEKWRPFVLRSEWITRWQALKAVLAGTSFALFTPNRLGEYGGRLLFVRPENHWKAFVANAVGSAAQYLVLLTGGLPGGIYFAGQLLKWNFYTQIQALVAAVFLLTGLYFCYFNIGLIHTVARRLPVVKKMEGWHRRLQLLEHFSRPDLLKVLGWSALRYVIYSTQYFLLLQFFGIKTGIYAGISGIATIFFLQTVVPLPAVASLLIRGNLAIFVWSIYSDNTAGILAATFVLWIINLILPALVGTFSLFNVNITKSLGYDDE